MTNIEDKINECVSKCDIFGDTLNSEQKNDFETYQKSFGDILEFEKPMKETEKKKIDYVFYNNQNNDGLMSGYIAYLYLILNAKTKNKSVVFKAVRPSSANTVNHRLKEFETDLKGKTLLICDVYYGVQTIKYLSSICKKIYIIDDHKVTKNNSTRFSNLSNVASFVGDTHCACAYTWKFFYPKKEIPDYIIEVDNKDKKLFLSFIDKTSQYITSYINFNLTNNPYLNKNAPDYFEKVHHIINKSNNYKKVVGKYYDEVENNIKDQVARNAKQSKFQGYNVIVLNYNDPVLYKKVARQMITNAEKQGQNIDFAVLWGWEYTSNAYKIFMSEKHTKGRPKYNLPQLASKLAKKGGHYKGGHGKEFVGNFYWPHNKNHDIWDLFH